MYAYSNISIRHAEASDLDALTRIGIAAFPYEPQWPYRYPFAADFPEDHWTFTRNRYSEWLDAAKMGDCAIIVAEISSLDDPSARKVVSLSIWRIPRFDGIRSNDKCLKPDSILSCPRRAIAKNLLVKPPKANLTRRDANSLHMAAYRMCVDQAQEEYFDRIYGTHQLSLAQLATHPDYWRRGAATMLLDWGFDISSQKRWPITVFAGPTAYSLYRKLGFKTAGMVTTKVLGEEEEIEFPGMTWEANDPGPQKNIESVPHHLTLEYNP
jgi:ribosomal protein S18 acetylase RimI-like enzyme